MKLTFIAGFGRRSDRLHSDALVIYVEGERDLQKFFCAFPSGSPGFGLLLLRALVALTLIAQTVGHFRSAELNLPNTAIAVLLLISGACLFLGFMTPVVAVVAGLGALVFGIFFEVSYVVFAIVILSAAIALLGPGAFSVDARLFGHREILIQPQKSAMRQSD